MTRQRLAPAGYYLSLFLLQWQTTFISAFVPPRPESYLAEHWESVHQRRRRLEQPFDYTPRFVHPELCRYLKEEECQDVDMSLQDHAQRQRSLFQKSPADPQQFDFYDYVEDNGLSSTSSLRGSPQETTPKSSNSSQTASSPLARRNPHLTPPGEKDIEILVVLMRFQDHQDRVLPDKSVYETLWNDRIHHWFDLNSQGSYRYHATVTDWMTTDDTEASFAAGVSGLRHDLQQSFWPLLDQLNSVPEWDWSKFDLNQDGKLDAVVVLHSGYPAEVGGYDCTNNRPTEDRIWSHAFASSFSWTTEGIMGPTEFEDYFEQQQLQQQIKPQPSEASPAPPAEMDPIYALHGYLIASALDGTCGSSPAKMGVMTHEFMHTLGLDDVYDYGADSPGKGIGYWDIMGYPYGPENDEDYPGHLSAYSKVSLGWLTPKEWNRGQAEMTMTLQPAEISNDAIKIPLTYGTELVNDIVSRVRGFPLNRTSTDDDDEGVETRLMPQYQSEDQYEEYLLLEFRQALEFDRDLNEKVGLVVYHVDESVPRMNNRGFPGQPDWPWNGNHYRVAVLGADTFYHLERGINKGDSGDTWKPGSVLGPGTAARVMGTTRSEPPKAVSNDKEKEGSTESTASGVTYPNTDTYQYGIVRETGIFIENVNESPTAVTVKLSWQRPVTETAQPAASSVVEVEANCLNKWDWVDLEVELEDGQLTVVSLHCNTVASDTDYYCGMLDFSWGWQVREICRTECPDSECFFP